MQPPALQSGVTALNSGDKSPHSKASIDHTIFPWFDSAIVRPELTDLVPFSVRGKVFAVYAQCIDGIAENLDVALLPRTPRAVLGVSCVRGRMLTVLDPIALCTEEGGNWEGQLPFVLALSGDEQLGLAAQACRDAITIATADLTIEPNISAERSPILGVVRHAGEEITVLDHKRLFAAATQRKERRRRRL